MPSRFRTCEELTCTKYPDLSNPARYPNQASCPRVVCSACRCYSLRSRVVPRPSKRLRSSVSASCTNNFRVPASATSFACQMTYLPAASPRFSYDFLVPLKRLPHCSSLSLPSNQLSFLSPKSSTAPKPFRDARILRLRPSFFINCHTGTPLLSIQFIKSLLSKCSLQ